MGHYHHFPTECRPQTLAERATEATRDLGSLQSKLALSCIMTEFSGDPDWSDIATAAGDIADGEADMVAEWLERCREFDREQDDREAYENWQERFDRGGFFSFADYREGFHRQGRSA